MNLDGAVARFRLELTQALAEVDGVSVRRVYLNYSRENWVRLLGLKMWTIRYRVSLVFIMRVLLKECYHRQRRNQRGVNATLGLNPAMLVGQAAQRCLEQAIQQHYPGGENLRDYQSQAKARILETYTGKPLVAKNSFELVKQYRNHIKHRRELLEHGAKDYTKPWRDNPWRVGKWKGGV